MTRNFSLEPFICNDLKAITWRIFGSGGSPLKEKSTYELIEPIVKRHLSPTNANRVINEIRGWFESHGKQRWLKSEMIEPVATLIVDGVQSNRDERAIWAVGSIETDSAVRAIRSGWSSEEIDSFVDRALDTLEKLCGGDLILNVSNAKIPKEGMTFNKGTLEIFQQLDSNDFELVHRDLHRATANLIELVVDLRPDQFKSVIERLDHPVMQARAADRRVTSMRRLNHRETLLWVTEDSCDALVALAIVHTLNTVNRLDEEIQLIDRGNADQQIRSTELRPAEDDLNTAAAGLLADLTQRLAALEPTACARWIGELLSRAPCMLRQSDDGEMPCRVKQLEKACTEVLARHVLQSWSGDLLTGLNAGLCQAWRPTWTRHLADIACEIRCAVPARAVEIARRSLDTHNHVLEHLEGNNVFLNWNDWEGRAWLRSLGFALALSWEDLDLPTWVSERCRALPLSVWDAEEDYKGFIDADRAAQHWFLIAFHAIEPMKELGRAATSESVRALAEKLWTYLRFAGQYLHRRSETSVVAEYAARLVVEFGEPSEAWLLKRARDPGVGPCTLWALHDQRKLKKDRKHRDDRYYDEVIASEFARIVSDRYYDGTQVDLESLRCWGRLWLMLGILKEAEHTAMAILAFPPKMRNRTDQILALKLLALVASAGRLDSATAGHLESLYGQLWSAYTPGEEREDRRQIDEWLNR